MTGAKLGLYLWAFSISFAIIDLNDAAITQLKIKQQINDTKLKFDFHPSTNTDVANLLLPVSLV